MGELKAFVGHSFADEDVEVVNKFLKFLDDIKDEFGLSWESAIKARPKELADKVLEIIKDKNLFIGICTKNEKVIDDENLQTNIFFLGKKIGKSNDFIWKTSDWIIQEIGLAYGQGMEVILLVEEGLRSPGGIQGNLELIYFNRQL